MQMREKVGKSRNTVFFQWFEAPEGRKVGSLKRRVRSQLARWEMKKCTPLWREAHFQVKMYKTHQRSDHFWKLRCRKSARRCGAKHISKSKCTKHTRFGPLLAVEMSKKCTPLWREAHFQVKMYKTHQVRTTFGQLRCRKSARRCGAKHISKSKCTKHHQRHFWRFGCWKSARRCGAKHILQNTPLSRPLLEVQMSLRTLRFTTLHYTTNYTTLHYTTLQIHYTTLHNTTTTTTKLGVRTTLHWTFRCTLHSTTLRSTTLHYIHYTPLHYITLHYTPLLHYITLHYLPLHSTTLHYTTLHYTTTTTTSTQLHSTTRNYTTLHYITLHYTTFHYTPLHYTTLHYNTLNDTAPQIDR